MEDFSLYFLMLAVVPIFAVVSIILLNNKKIMHIISMTVSVIIMIPYMFLVNGVVKYGKISVSSQLQFYMDGLSALVLGIVLLVVFFASIYNLGYLNEGLKNKSYDTNKFRFYYALFYTFVWTMILTMITGNIGQMWIGIEATTLSSAFLVGMYSKKRSLEAAWKYIIICSVGIAMALLGVIFLHMSTVSIVQGTGLELHWPTIINNVTQIDTNLLRISFIFMLVGFGTKAGLAPMNTWLPDAYSEAPAPISAVLSGCLSNISMYAIMREIAIVNKTFGYNLYTGRLMFGFALFSMLIAAIFIFNQKDYKRLLAYSSIEHMGIIVFGLGIFTPLSVFASLLHMVNHSLTKTMLFLASGNVFEKFRTKKIVKIKGILKSMPVTGIVFLLGIFAITGMPPFSVFISELSMIISGFKAGHKYKTLAFVLLVAIVFVGFAIASFKMFYGEDKNHKIDRNEKNIPGAVAIGILLILITVTGLYIPIYIFDLITMAQRVIMGG